VQGSRTRLPLLAAAQIVLLLKIAPLLDFLLLAPAIVAQALLIALPGIAALLVKLTLQLLLALNLKPVAPAGLCRGFAGKGQGHDGNKRGQQWAESHGDLHRCTFHLCIDGGWAKGRNVTMTGQCSKPVCQES